MWKLTVVVSWVLAALAVEARSGSPRGQACTAELDAYTLPPKDAALQTALEGVLQEAPFRKLVAAGRLSVAVADTSVTGHVRFAGVHEDEMRYAASLPKIAVMLAVFQGVEDGTLAYTPALTAKLEAMIRKSNNRASSDLIALVGFESIAGVLQDPRYELYDPERNGGLWVGKDYGGELGYWKRDPMHAISHGATARQVARFFVMLDQELLVSPWASQEMKRILGKPAIRHKFVLGLSRFRDALVFRKSGTWKRWHSDAALVERGEKTYIVVALLESSQAKGVLSRLAVRIDGIIQPATPSEAVWRDGAGALERVAEAEHETPRVFALADAEDAGPVEADQPERQH